MRCIQRLVTTCTVLAVLATTATAEKIVDLRIEGLVHVNRKVIEALLTIKKGDELDQAQVERDFATIIELGYFDAEKSEGSIQPVTGGVEVVFRFVENPIVSSVTVRDVKVPAVDRTAIEAIAKKYYVVGQIFSHEAWPRLRNEILRAYRQAGYLAEVPPPTVRDDGTVVVTVAEITVDRVELEVYPENSYLDVNALKEWIGIRQGSAYSPARVDERALAILSLGFFVRFEVLELESQDSMFGRVLRMVGFLEERPVVTPEGSAFVDPQKVLNQLQVYRIGHLPASRVLSPPPSDGTLSSMWAASRNSPQDGRLAGELALALARAERIDAAVQTAQQAVTLLRGSAQDPQTKVLLARCALLAGDAAYASSLLTSLERERNLPPEGYPALIQTATYLLADLAVQEESAARIPGDTMAWATKVLTFAPNRQEIQATPQGAAFSAALAGAWQRFSSMSDQDLALHHEAYERMVGMFTLLRSAEDPFDPVDIVPECADLLNSPIQPILNDPRLLAALEARGSEDPDARYAWAACVILRELAVLLLEGPVELRIPAAERSRQLDRALAALQELINFDPEKYRRAEGLRALAFIVQDKDYEAQEALMKLLDTPQGEHAAQLYLLAASLNPGRKAQSADEVNQACIAAADRLSVLIADGQPHPQARYARYTLLGAAGRIDEAIAEANQVIQSGANDPLAWATLGFLEAKRGNLENAETALAKAVSLDPSDAYAAYTLGLVRWIRTKDAVAHLPLMERLKDESAVDLAAAEIAF